MTRSELRIISILRNHPLLYRLALAWPDLEKGVVEQEPGPGTPGEIVHNWIGVTFSFQEWATLADVAPKETLRGFDRLKAYGIILPDGTLHPAAEKFFGAALQAAFKLRPKKAPKEVPPEGE